MDPIEKLVRLPLLAVGNVDGGGNVAADKVVVANIYDGNLHRANEGYEISPIDVSDGDFGHRPVSLRR